MANYQMEVIPEPAQGTASVLVFDKKGQYVIIKGQGHDNFLCGACQNVICEGINEGQINNLVFKCPNCDSYNLLRSNMQI
jgi:hypothetical protein